MLTTWPLRASLDKCVWVAKPGGLFAAILSQEVALIAGQDWKTFLLMGITVAGKKCSVIRDNLLVGEEQHDGCQKQRQ